jgi:hypothetical protein
MPFARNFADDSTRPLDLFSADPNIVLRDVDLLSGSTVPAIRQVRKRPQRDGLIVGVHEAIPDPALVGAF